MADLCTVTIDGKTAQFPKGTLLVEAAREMGIEVPVYCYHPKMKPVGACRVCVVEVEKQRRPIMTACTTTVMDGMVVHTRSENAIAAREGILEFLLINHPLDCPVCDRGGECDLQDFTLRYGPPTTRFVEAKRHFEKSKVIGRNIVLDRERCIMCQRCARFCDEIAMEEGLVIIERGARSEIGTFEGCSFDSQFSGNTVEICPVGALTSREYRFKARPWELQHYAGVCTQCSMGCNVTVDVRFDEVARFRSRVNDAIDDGWLCDRGRYGFAGATSPDRPLKPQLRRDGKLVEVSWEEAFEAAVEGLDQAEKVGAVCGPSVSNEAGFALVGLMRGTLSSPHLDHRRGLSEPVEATAKIHGLDTVDLIVVLDCDPTETHPVLDLRIKKGLRNGARLVTLHSEPVGLDRYADVALKGDSGKQLSQLTKLAKKHKPEEATLRYPGPRPWEPGGSTSDEMGQAARLLAEADKVVVISHELSENLPEAAKLGSQEAPHGLLVMGLGANSQGLKEIGVMPNWGPGWTALDQVESFQDFWSFFQSEKGMDYSELVTTKLDALLVVEDQPYEQDQKKAEFVVVLASAHNETVAQADVVLPVCHWLEQTQTFTNSDGTVQLSRQAIAPSGESRPAWRVLCQLSEGLGGEVGGSSARELYAAIGKTNPLYPGCSYRDFTSAATQHWSYPQQGKLGTPRPDLSAIPVESPDAAPWIATQDMGSRVSRVARLLKGDLPPSVPGQADPREVARLMGIDQPFEEIETREDSYIPLRVVPNASAQPPGPSPSQRHHTFGVGPVAVSQIPEAPAEEQELETEEASS